MNAALHASKSDKCACGCQAQVQQLKGESARLKEENAASAEQAQAHICAIQGELAHSRQHCQQLQLQHCEALAAVKADTKSRAAALQQQLTEVSGERDFFMAQSSESASLAAQAVQERDAAQDCLAKAETSLKLMQQVTFYCQAIFSWIALSSYAGLLCPGFGSRMTT